jgi:hypothetical protein
MRPLAAFLTLTIAACSSRDVVEAQRILVDVGMTSDEVVRRLGAPERKIRVPSTSTAAEQTTEVWDYTLEGPPTPGDFIGLVLAAGALVLVVAAGGGGGGGIHGGNFPTYRFYVGFGPDGRVRGVTRLEKLK